MDISAATSPTPTAAAAQSKKKKDVRAKLQDKLLARGATLSQPPTEDRKSIKEALAESEARELDFDPAARVRVVKQLLAELPRMKAAGKTMENVQEEMSDLYEQYPEIFKKIWSGDDLDQLHFMIKMMDHMEKRELTPHQASVIIGRQLANTYIPDNLRESEEAPALAPAAAQPSS
jgi:hypothetical protein